VPELNVGEKERLSDLTEDLRCEAEGEKFVKMRVLEVTVV